ncbi:MAG: hypothetical protein QGH74_01420, partial [Candidatus Brocadiia bacterium]|nr:hypothetical protein [Candidatus Brocadiia bacterium]
QLARAVGLKPGPIQSPKAEIGHGHRKWMIGVQRLELRGRLAELQSPGGQVEDRQGVPSLCRCLAAQIGQACIQLRIVRGMPLSARFGIIYESLHVPTIGREVLLRALHGTAQQLPSKGLQSDVA